eukprot:gene1963-2325_t
MGLTLQSYLRGISPDVSAKNWSLNHAEYQSISKGFVELAFSADCKYIPALALYNSNPTELALLSTDKLEGGGGVGLKLRVVQSIVQSHKGVLSVNLEEKGPGGFHAKSYLTQMESPQMRGIQTAGYEGAASKFRVDSERGQGREDSEKCRGNDNEDEDQDKAWEDEEEDMVAEEKSVSSRCLADPPKAKALLRKQGSTSNVRIRIYVSLLSE